MELNFQSHGSGFPLIILHGLLGSSDNWQSLGKFWGESFQTFTLDLRNHGRSPHSDAFDYEVMAQDLADFMAQQKLQRAHILGHSMGGKVAMWLALTQPQLVEKLVVIDMATRAYPPSHVPIFKAMLALDLSAFKERSEIDAKLAASITEPALRQFLVKNIRRNEDGTFDWKINLQGIYDKYANVIQALPDAVAFDHQALFVRGGKSDYISASDEPAIFRLFPNACIETIPEAGHWVHAEAPLKLREMVKQFLQTDAALTEKFCAP